MVGVVMWVHVACWEDCSCDVDASVRGVAESGEAPSCNCTISAYPVHPLW